MEFESEQPVKKTAEAEQPVEKTVLVDNTMQLSRLSDEYLSSALPDSASSFVIKGSTDSPNATSNLENIAMSNKATRLGYVTAKGLAGVPFGVIDGISNDIDHPENFAAKAGGGLVFGAAMRTSLAKSGVGRAVAGSVFAFYLVKDALTPVSESYSQAWSAESVNQLNAASDHLSQGLGHFTYDAGLTIGFANVGERVTEKALRSALGSRNFSRFESYKQEMWTSDNHFLGRNINRSVRAVDNVKTAISEKLNLSKPSELPIPAKPKLTDIEVEHRAGAGLNEYAKHVNEKQTYNRGLPLKTGERLGLSETVDLLEVGVNPRAITMAEAKNALKLAGETRLAELKPEVRGLRATEEPVPGKGDTTVDTGIKGEVKVEGKTEGKPEVKPETNTGKTLTEKIEGETNPENITGMAKLMTEQMGRWDEEGMMVADRVELDIGPVFAALKTKHVPLDPGYGVAARQMFGLAEQVKRGDDYQQVGTLFGYLRDATNQWNLGNATKPAQLAQELNLLSIEIHTGLKQGLRRAGLKPDEILDAKNPPLFTVRNDGGAGPHTIPEIQGVWDVDVVLWPRNMVEARSTAASGINGHEIGHNQYGGLLRFEESIRDEVIGNAVKRGLDAFRKDRSAKSPEVKVEDSIEVPGHGKVSKQELYEDILKAQANENTSDIWGTAWTGPNSGLSLGVLLQSLRTGGKLETRSVFGQEYVGEGSRFGFEVHGMDRFRVKLSAEVLRQRSNNDPLVLEYAKALDRYAEAASRDGDYVWASLEHPGKNITVPKAEFEAMIPHLVEVQLNQPLPALKGKTFGEILPDLPTHVGKMNELADIVVDGAMAGREPTMIPFDVNTYTINQVFGSGMPAAMRLMSRGMSAKDANAWVNKYSDHFRSQYLKLGDPHVEPIGPSFNVGQLQLDPVKAITSRGLKGLSDVSGSVRNGVERHATKLSGYPGGMLSESIFGTSDKDTSDMTLMDLTRKQILEDEQVKKDVLGH